MTIQDVLREMREMREINSNFRVTAEWVSAIEAAMREPVCTVDDLQFMNLHGTELEPGTNLFTLPPDAQAEITVLREDKERLMDRIDGCHQSMREKDAEIERLWALFSHWYEMWNDGIPNPDGDVLDDTVAALAGKEDV